MKMIKYALLLILAGSPAVAAERLTLQLSPNDAATILNSLQALDGSPHIVRNALGQEEVKLIPLDLGAVRLTIARDETVLIQTVKEFQQATRGLAIEPSSDAKPADVRRANEKIDALANTKMQVDLLSLDVADLNMTANRITPSTLAVLAPICPTCVGLDAPKPAERKP
jgi:hypothetical protein